jgi:hypothetical protein
LHIFNSLRFDPDTWVSQDPTRRQDRSKRFDLANNDNVAMHGSFTFTSDVTNLALASFLLGKMRSFTQGLGQPEI